MAFISSSRRSFVAMMASTAGVGVRSVPRPNSPPTLATYATFLVTYRAFLVLAVIGGLAAGALLVDTITDSALHQSRLTGAHPSSFAFRREWLLSDVGLVDEKLPHGYGEDFDLLLRAAQVGRITLVKEPLVDVLWHSGSFFSQRWSGMAEGLGYVIDKHPALAGDARGFAWIEGQRAFALAAKGDERKAALRAASRSIRSRFSEPRGWLAIGVALKLLNPEWIMRTLNARGRGI